MLVRVFESMYMICDNKNIIKKKQETKRKLTC